MTTINRPCDKTVCFRPVARVEKHFALKDDNDSQERDEDCQRNFEPAYQLLHFRVNPLSNVIRLAGCFWAGPAAG